MAVINIPCIHNNYLTNSPESSYERIRLKIAYHDIVRLVYHDDERSELSSFSQCFCVRQSVSNPLNPFCPHCKTDVVNNFSSSPFSSYSISDIDKIIEELRVRVHKNIRKMHQIRHKHRGQIPYKDVIIRIVRRQDLHQGYDDLPELGNSYFLNSDEATAQPRPTPASRVAIEELERVKVVADDGESETRLMAEGDYCVVCLERLRKKKAGEVMLVRLPCEHMFHEDCVVDWLRTSHVCPLCRFELPVDPRLPIDCL